MTLKNDFEQHVIHKKTFVEAQEYIIYKYVESSPDGELPPSQVRAHRRPDDANQEERNLHDDTEFDDAERKPGLVISCKIARKFGFYVYTAFIILVSAHAPIDLLYRP